MNKLFSKVAALSVGLAMAIGVGVAVGSKEVVVARAESVTLSASAFSSSWSGTRGAQSGSSQGFTVETTDGLYSTQLRHYAGATLTVTSSVGNMTSVVFTCTASGTANYGPGKMSGEGYVASSGTTGTWTGNAASFSLTGGQSRITSIEITYTGSALEQLTIKNASSETGPFEHLNSKFVGGYMFYAYDEGGTQQSVEFSVDKTSFASVTDNGDGSCCVYPLKAGSVVLSAELDGYKTGSATLSFDYPFEHDGTSADPYTVAEGIGRAQMIGETASGEYYVRGYISAITSTESDVTSYGNATFNLSDDAEDNTNVLIAFQVKYIGNVAFTAETFAELKVGHIAVVRGALVNYKSTTPEFSGKSTSNLVSLEAPSTGDIDITFDPETSIEIGDTGTFTAVADATNPIYSWSVEDDTILSVDSDGSFEALSYGQTKVTVSVTADEGTGEASAFITVNGGSYLTVDSVLTHISSLSTEDMSLYYVKVEGFVSSLSYKSGGKDAGIVITNMAETSNIIVYTGTGGYSDFASGLSIGSCVRVRAKVQNYHGDTPELTGSPVREYVEYVAMTFAQDFLDATDAVCAGYDGVTDNKEALESVWSTLTPKYTSDLSDLQRNVLGDPTSYGAGNTVKNAMARYDYLVAKYNLDHFITTRAKISLAGNFPVENNALEDSSMTIIIVIAAISALAFTTLLVVKKKKHN